MYMYIASLLYATFHFKVHFCHRSTCVKLFKYKLDTESRELRDLESQGPWAVAFRVIVRTLLQDPKLLHYVIPDDEASN